MLASRAYCILVEQDVTESAAEGDGLVGTVLNGRFELVNWMAKGAMGHVYRAIQHPLEREVVVKLLDPGTRDQESFQRRFFLEAALCSRLSHPNIVRVYDYGCHEGRIFYIAMEHLRGQDLHQLMKETGPLEPARAVGMLKQACGALAEAHSAGLVHRDLKPSNLFVVPHGLGGDFIKILDFGVVKDLTDVDATLDRKIVGSPLTMAPEQIRCVDVDGRSDVYALGVILYAALTGAFPFVGPTVTSVLKMHLTEPVRPFAVANPDLKVPPALEQLVLRAMEKEPHQRFAGAMEMLAALEDVTSSLPELSNGSSGHEGEPPEEPEAVQTFAQLEATVVDNTWDALAQSDVGRLLGEELDGYVAYIDLNCPYCFALYERLARWCLTEQVTWRMVEHVSHLLDGPFELEDERLLSTEVFEVHHRAPDVQLNLPSRRCSGTRATRLIVLVEEHHPAAVGRFRGAVYRAMWQGGLDIGSPEVLAGLLRQEGLPTELLEGCDTEPEALAEWQRRWEDADFDCCIPVLTHEPTERVLIGLADEQSLGRFLLGDGHRVVDSGVCFYQRRPTILLCGWLQHLWGLLEEVRESCEVIQATSLDHVSETLAQVAVPELIIVQTDHIAMSALEEVASLARSRSVPWVVATRRPSPEEEVQVLSLGAVEFLSLTGDLRIGQARLMRVLRDRYELQRSRRDVRHDQLTRLPTRHAFLETLELEWDRAVAAGTPLSLVLIDLDEFKAYNKCHGYLSGDHVLTDLADRLGRDVRAAGGMLARFGGNEFACLLPQTGRVQARELRDRLTQTISEEAIPHRANSRGQHLTASAGVYTQRPGAAASVLDMVDGATRDLHRERVG